MSHSMMNFTKGIVTGVVVGTTVGMAVRSMRKSSRPYSFKRNAAKTLKNAGHFINGLTGMIQR